MQQKKCVTHRGSSSVFLLLGLLCAISACAQDKNERISAVYDLKANPTPRNVETLRELTRDPDHDVRATALNALVSLRADGAAEATRRALEDDAGFVRATAAKLLADLGDPADAVPLAVKLREDTDPVVRRRAAEALSRLGSETALAALTAGLRDPVEDVRLAAARGLRELDPGYAKADLSRLLLEDPNHDVRVQAAGALGESGDAEVLPVLEAALADPNEFVRAAVANAMRVHRAKTSSRGAAQADPRRDGGRTPGQ